jgi:MFS family permease
MMTVIIEEQGISTSQAGLIMTVWWVAVAVHTAPGGRLADKLSHKTGLMMGLTLAVIGTLFLTSATVYPLLLLGLGIVGAGRGVYQSSAVGQISDLFTEQRGQALGLRVGAFDLGGVLAGVLAAVVLSLTSWQMSFVPILVFISIIMVMMHLWNGEEYVVNFPEFNLRSSIHRLTCDSDIRYLILSLSMFGFVWNGATSFLPAYLRFSKDFSPTTASLSFSGLFLIGAIISPFAGQTGDRFGHYRIGTASIIVCGLGLIGLLLFQEDFLVFGALIVFATGLAAYWPVVTALGVDLLPSNTRAGDWGMITTIFLLAESGGSAHIGILAENASYTIAYASLLLCLLLSLVTLSRVTSDQ